MLVLVAEATNQVRECDGEARVKGKARAKRKQKREIG